MKKILIVGDSLTAGHPGAGFVNILTRSEHTHQVLATGRGGDTLLGISRRLLPLITRHVPDIVVIEAGANDILLPWFRTRTGSWKHLADRLETSGSIPTTEVAAFHALYSETITAVRQSAPEIIVTTITCLGEDINNELNQQRRKYNEAIRLLAAAREVHLADAGKAFDDILQTMPRASPYLLNEYSNLYWDTLLTTVDRATDFLSRRRGLALTVDGVHLNRQGAQIFAETIQNTLRCLS